MRRFELRTSALALLFHHHIPFKLPYLGHTHERRHHLIHVHASVGDGLVLTRLSVHSLKRRVERLELHCRLLLRELRVRPDGTDLSVRAINPNKQSGSDKFKPERTLISQRAGRCSS